MLASVSMRIISSPSVFVLPREPSYSYMSLTWLRPRLSRTGLREREQGVKDQSGNTPP